MYCFFGLLDFIRMQIIRAQSEKTTQVLVHKAYEVSILNNCAGSPSKEKKSAVADVQTLRHFTVSPTFTAFFDLPWTPIFLVFIFGLHPALGFFSLICAAILCVLAIVNERLSNARIKKANKLTSYSSLLAENSQRSAAVFKGNGMIDSFSRVWKEADQTARLEGLRGGTVNSAFSTSTKTLRMAIQSLILAAGAYLVIQAELSPGGIIAASVVFGRLLAPIEQLLNSYSQVVNARSSWRNINTWLFDENNDTDKKILNPPESSLQVHQVHVRAPNSDKLILKNINFNLQAGDILGITGPSGSGKSTLAKTLVGAWPPVKGKVCLDNADLDQWPQMELGKHIGYVPQDIDFFCGSIAENIARFREDMDFDKVLKASDMAGTHEFILSLNDGYNTALGEGGTTLTGGQRQRIALARALYDDPFFVVMDEPSSNLDGAGVMALTKALEKLKEQSRIVIFITHQKSMLSLAGKLMLLQEGEIKAFGKPEEIVKAAQAQGMKPPNMVSNINGQPPKNIKPVA